MSIGTRSRGRHRSTAQQPERTSSPPPDRFVIQGPSTPSITAPAGLLAGLPGNLNLAQCARLITGLLWLGWVDWWGQQPWAVAPALGLLEAMGALIVMALAVLVRSEAGTRRLDAVLIFGTLLLVGVVGVAAGTSQGYGTDELAYGQAAASALLHGVNPYSADFTSALQTFGVAAGGTLTLHATLVPSIAYPSMSFLLYVPAVALMGDHSFAGIVVDLAVWVGAGALLWRLMTPAVRPWVPILLAVPVLLISILGGTNDSLYVPLELVAIWRWDRFADSGERSAARWVGPIALGLACGVKQHPWLIAPFLLAGVMLEAHRRGADWKRVGLRYFSTASAVFLIPNIPFILWNPGAWLSRIVLPFTGGLLPRGIGPASLLAAYRIGGGNLSMFALASATAMLATVILYFRHYPLLRRVIPMLPLAALFVSTRSFSSYFAFFVPALAVNAATIRSATAVTLHKRLWRPMGAVAVATGAASIGFVVAAVLWPAPMRVTILSSRAGASTMSVSVIVDNLSNRAVKPHFILAKGPGYQQAMSVVEGPATLSPHSSATFRLTTYVLVMTPHTGEPIQVEVTTTAPDTFSSSPVTSAPGGG